MDGALGYPVGGLQIGLDSVSMADEVLGGRKSVYAPGVPR